MITHTISKEEYLKAMKCKEFADELHELITVFSEEYEIPPLWIISSLLMAENDYTIKRNKESH